MNILSQTEWSPDIFYRCTKTSVGVHRQGRKKRTTRTRHSSVPKHLVIVPTTIAAAKVQRLMHIAQKVNEELECLLRRLRRSTTTRDGRQRAAGAGSKVDQDGADVPYGVEDVDALAAHPAVLAGKLTVVRRVVADAFAEVQWGGPRGAIVVGPGGDRREVARRAVGGTEEGADGAQGPWVEVRLSEGCDDSVAFLDGGVQSVVRGKMCGGWAKLERTFWAPGYHA